MESPRSVRGTTEFVGLIGDPVAHSLSPLLHNCAYRELDIDLVYGAFRVPVGEVRSAVMGARSLGFRGLSITTPHKEEAALCADQRTREVELLGATNTLVYMGSVAVGESTDGEGFVDDLQNNCDYPLDGRRCAILGAGGAARSIILALAAAQVKEIVIVNRSVSRAEQAQNLAPECARIGSLDDVRDCELVINATSFGLTNDGPEGTQATCSEVVGTGQFAVDLIYNPPRTAFLEGAASHGARIRNGLGMLVHQAALQVELFTHETAPLQAMWKAVSHHPTA